MNNAITYKTLLGLAAVCLATAVTLAIRGNITLSGPFLIAFFVLLALGVRGFPLIKGMTFSIAILAVVVTALYYPQLFIEYGGFELAVLIVPLIQIIMFGMGCSMGIEDFIELARAPKSVFVGVVSQFIVMPLLGFALASFSSFSSEIAAGIILLGCAPTSVAASVMCFLARANVALAITITAVTTLLAPLVIPLLMKLLAGGFIEIDVLDMMWGLIKMVLVPVGAGLLFNKFLSGRAQWLDNAMPMVSMIGVLVIVAIIIAAGRESILNIGFALISNVLLLVVLGYLLGYWFARLFKLNPRDVRTISIATGMQNAGLISGIAKVMGKIATVGLATAICGPIMGVTSSILAAYWNNHPPQETEPNLSLNQ